MKQRSSKCLATRKKFTDNTRSLKVDLRLSSDLPELLFLQNSQDLRSMTWKAI